MIFSRITPYKHKNISVNYCMFVTLYTEHLILNNDFGELNSNSTSI